ncbi:MAG: hypothetical protein IKM29_02960 [Clostridia bacterium]|nr:hypothetical protein [Clostridia bacterium]
MSFTEIVLFGAAFFSGAVSGVGAGMVLFVLFCEKGRITVSAEETIPEASEPDSESLRLARQYENIMNYDGTERGQQSLEK